jgi:hypothetical protein
MFRSTFTFVIGLAFFTLANGQTMTFATSSSDYEITTVFSNVDSFMIEIEIDAPLAPGIYVDPDIIGVNYRVTGVLEPGTPSDFPSFDLRRNITGAEFYAQGSSLSFEIAQSAVVSDGIQAAELIGDTLIVTFNAREVDNGRFHPALLELHANGLGRIQNSNNVPTLSPLVEVDFGAEYITDLVFDPGNTTLISETPATIGPVDDGGGSTVSPLVCGILILFAMFVTRKRLRR